MKFLGSKLFQKSHRMLFIALLASVYFSCSDKKTSIDIPEVESIEVSDISFVRFDRVVSQMDTSNINNAYLQTVSKYPNITDLYFKKLLNFDSSNKDSFYNSIAQFVAAPEIQELQDTIDGLYPDTKDIEDEFKQAFRFIKYYFPDYELPNVYFFQTEFGYQTILFSDLERDGVGVGLDMFLGDIYNYKNLDPTNPSFSTYLTRTYNRDHIVKKVLDMIIDELLGQSNGKRFIDQIIHQGKKIFLLRRLLPYAADTVVTEFSQAQMDWLYKNELEMWSFFLEQDIMYETSFLKVDKYIYPSPSSPGMPKEAPGRTGSFIGWLIVESYMDRYPELTINDLLTEVDAQKLMEKSKYKPKRR